LDNPVLGDRDMKRRETMANYLLFASLLFLAVISFTISSCGGGGGGNSSSAGATHSVTLTWEANHESGVNSAGGGYQVSVSSQATTTTINVPFVSGPSAPTSTTILLNAGSYTVTVRAYAALDTQGGNTGSMSAASAPITVIVPQW
jgi:hypothetical protein